MGYVDRLLGNNEQIVFLTRQHWLVLVWTALQDGILMLLAFAAALILRGPIGGIAGVFAILAVFPIVHFTLRYLNWHNEQFIITNRRVMQVRGIINKRVSDSSLEKVNDVVLVQSILGRFLGYGMVEIITGSDIGVNIFRYMAQPVRFKTEMLNQKEGMTQLESFGTAASRVLSEEPPTSGDIPELIAELDELRRRGIITDKEFKEKKTDLLSRI